MMQDIKEYEYQRYPKFLRSQKKEKIFSFLYYKRVIKYREAAKEFLRIQHKTFLHKFAEMDFTIFVPTEFECTTTSSFVSIQTADFRFISSFDTQTNYPLLQ